jgi:uncharacterized repeat protein (TIGR01451 family)
VFIAAKSKSQYVNIPDSNFRSFLIGKYPSCFNGAGQMDTTCIDTATQNRDIIVGRLSIKSIDGVKYLKHITSLDCSGNELTSLLELPHYLKKLNCSSNFIDSLKGIEDYLIELDCSFNNLASLPKLTTTTDSLRILNCSFNKINVLPELPYFLTYLNCGFNKLINLPNLPHFLNSLWCAYNSISIFPNIPKTLKNFNCSGNLLNNLPALPNTLNLLACSDNKLLTLDKLPDSLLNFDCKNTNLTILPLLPKTLAYLDCSFNKISTLPRLPNSLKRLLCESNEIFCLPHLPDSLEFLSADYMTKIKCFPNYCVILKHYSPGMILGIPYCSQISNPNQCHSFPIIKSLAFTDINNNSKLDPSEFIKQNIKLNLSSNNNTYTNSNGIAELTADSLGTYTITATPPAFYNSVPASYTHTFTNYDTLVIDTFALQPNVLKDSISIKLTPISWAARAGCAYPYLVSYENVGTTVLSKTFIDLHYDNSLLNYDSSSNNAVANNGSNLSVNMGNILSGQTGGFIAYFNVKATAALGSSVVSTASITTNSVAANDTITTIVRGSYDPNDKQATPFLTTQQVGEGKYIDYTIRFQNTGTDTAFNVVIADTLDSKLQANQLQIGGSSHSCKTTVKDNIIFFEFLDILLPDSNINKLGSNGFVSFKIKPIASITNGSNIPNKAAIYFDYNSPVITKAANTIIANPLPLQLLNFNAIAQKETDKILVYWTTLNEVNTSYFIIEQSIDGIVFKAAAEVAANGTVANSYYFTIDRNKVKYVRLKMVDKNGQFNYSNTIKINSNVQSNNGLIFLENPAKDQIKLNVISPTLTNTIASFVNSQGKILKSFVLKQGFQTIDINGFADGVYYLKTNTGSRSVVIFSSTH